MKTETNETKRNETKSQFSTSLLSFSSSVRAKEGSFGLTLKLDIPMHHSLTMQPSNSRFQFSPHASNPTHPDARPEFRRGDDGEKFSSW